jgi:hypothetical protein
MLGPSPLRRLTAFEYDNTVRDLLGDSTRPGRRFPEEAKTAGFVSGAQGAPGQALVDAYREAAEALAARADVRVLSGCDPAAAGEEACARQFVMGVGKRAFRRPLDAAETTRLMAVFTKGRPAGTFASALQLTVQAMLQSAPFLYRIETGGAPDAAVVRVTGWEMASRLSYLLWGSLPDKPLFDAAEAGALETPEQIAAQARRMLADPRARQAVASFHDQWLALDEADGLDKDTRVFPAFTTALPGLFRTETSRLIEHLTWDEPGGWQRVLTAPFTFANGALAKFYGLKGPAGAAFERVSLEGTPRLGFLTQGSFLAVQAKRNQTSPVVRGQYVRERLLCQQPPPPPPDVGGEVQEPDGKLTTRERYAAHASKPSCASCHRLMDPIGLGLENFDGAGQWRTTEAGKPIDASGEIVDSDVTGRFDGAAALARKLAASTQASRCVANHWFRFAFGRAPTEADACTVETLAARLGAGASARDVLLTLVASDAFLHRPPGGKP